MSNGDVSQGRRRFLIGASAKAEAAGAPVTVNISKIEPGQQITVEWRGKPVWIIRRTEEMLANIEKLNDAVKDPMSEAPQQPSYIQGPLRAIKPEFGVYVGLCTHLGCVPSYRPEVAPADLGENWLGGLFCPCHGSRYDMAGRVYEAQPAPLNLEVPPYRFDDDVTMTIGLDPEAA